MSLLLLLGGSAGVSMSARTLGGLSGVPVAPGWNYAGKADVRTDVTARSATLGIRWYDSAGVLVSTSSGSAAADSSTAWTTLSVGPAACPTTGAFAALVVTWAGVVSTEVHYVDNAALVRLANPYQ